MGEKRGRPKSQALDALNGDQVWHRLAEDAEALGLDSRIRTQIGRLVLKRLLTATQAAAADLIGRVYGRWERLHDKKRSCRSPSYEFSTAGPRERYEDPDWIDQTERDFAAVQATMPRQRTSETRDAIETLCVEDRRITTHQLNLIYPVLNEVSIDFGLGPEAPATSSPLARTRSKPRMTRQERILSDEYSAHTRDTMPKTPLDLRQRRREKTIGEIMDRESAREGLHRTLRRQAQQEAAEQGT